MAKSDAAPQLSWCTDPVGREKEEVKGEDGTSFAKDEKRTDVLLTSRWLFRNAVRKAGGPSLNRSSIILGLWQSPQLRRRVRACESLSRVLGLGGSREVMRFISRQPRGELLNAL